MKNQLSNEDLYGLVIIKLLIDKGLFDRAELTTAMENINDLVSKLGPQALVFYLEKNVTVQDVEGLFTRIESDAGKNSVGACVDEQPCPSPFACTAAEMCLKAKKSGEALHS